MKRRTPMALNTFGFGTLLLAFFSCNGEKNAINLRTSQPQVAIETKDLSGDAVSAQSFNFMIASNAKKECNQKNHVYDWANAECIEDVALADFPCSMDEIKSSLSYVANLDEILADLAERNLQLDQCGIKDNRLLIYFSKFTEDPNNPENKNAEFISIGDKGLLSDILDPEKSFQEIINPPGFDECQKNGFIFDRRNNHCTDIEIAKFACNEETIAQHFWSVDNFKDMWKSLMDEEWILDQCGLNKDGITSIYFVKKDISPDRKEAEIQVKILKR